MFRQLSKFTERATKALGEPLEETKDQSEAAVYKELLVDMQFQQLVVTREYQQMVKENQEEIRRLKTKLGEVRCEEKKKLRPRGNALTGTAPETRLRSWDRRRKKRPQGTSPRRSATVSM
jgi:hypothetical protein